MNPHDTQALARWLEAERAGLDDLADESLAGLFRSVPRLRPRPGFADRVLRAGVPARRAAWTWTPWWMRAGIAFTLLLCGLAAAFIPVARLSPLIAVSWARVVPLCIDASVRILWWLQHGVAVWRAVAGVGRAGAVVLTTGPALAVLTANIALAIVLTGALKHLLSSEEEWSRC